MTIFTTSTDITLIFPRFNRHLHPTEPTVLIQRPWKCSSSSEQHHVRIRRVNPSPITHTTIRRLRSIQTSLVQFSRDSIEPRTAAKQLLHTCCVAACSACWIPLHRSPSSFAASQRNSRASLAVISLYPTICLSSSYIHHLRLSRLLPPPISGRDVAAVRAKRSLIFLQSTRQPSSLHSLL